MALGVAAHTFFVAEFVDPWGGTLANCSIPSLALGQGLEGQGWSPKSSDMRDVVTTLVLLLVFRAASVGPFGLVVASVEQTAAGAHAFAQLWALLGRQLDTDLRPETEALHLVRLGEKHHKHRSIVDSQSARLDGRA